MYSNGLCTNCNAREEWRASMIHIAIEGMCFALFANQFRRRKDYPLPLKCIDGC
ncbi:hypothetical protein V6Z11_D13G031700 [Gossypium hirsutum]